jgi:protein-disulfide isomerase
VSDLQCPFCKDWHEQVFPKIVNEFVKTGKIRLAYVNFPLSQHKYARTAAVAAMCASAQDKFWPMHDALFTSQTKWEKIDDPAPFFEGLAAKSGVNLPAWKSCLSSTSVAALIDADLDRARRAGVQSTPSFIVGGRLIEGAVPYDEFKRAINEAIATGRK